MPSIFQTISRIVYGFGAVDLLPDEVKRFGDPRVLIITDKGLVANNMHKPVEDALKNAGVPVKVWGDVVLDPTPESIEACVEVIKEFNATVLIGLGGGSAMDSTKAASLRACHPGPVTKYFGMHKVPGPCMPTIMIPTTAGTGSEMTSISVIGLDAFVHAMESYVNLSATPFTEGPDLQAMLMISDNLRKAYTNGKNRAAREAMLYASSICGMGFSNTQNGVIHAIGMAVPATYHLPHGLLMAACGPMGIAFNCHAAPEKYAEVAEILGCDTKGKSVVEAAEMAVEGFTKLMRDVDIEPGLRIYGVKEEDIPGIAQRAAASARLMNNNPRQGTAEQLEALIRKYF